MTTPNFILGISAYYHDSAACLLRDGEIVAAAQEERFTRKKGDASFPRNAVDYCLERGGIVPSDLSYVAFYDKPLLKFERILETYLGVVPRGLKQFLMAGPLWIKEKLFMDRSLREELEFDGEVLYAEHHESHAASAFYPGTKSGSRGSCTGRIRSACCTQPSPISRASRSTPASTRSWAWLRTVSRNSSRRSSTS